MRIADVHETQIQLFFPTWHAIQAANEPGSLSHSSPEALPDWLQPDRFDGLAEIKKCDNITSQEFASWAFNEIFPHNFFLRSMQCDKHLLLVHRQVIFFPRHLGNYCKTRLCIGKQVPTCL